MGFRVTTICAWTCIGDDDEEGVIGVWLDGEWFPLIVADETCLPLYHTYAQAIATESGRPVRLRRFSGGETVETLDP